MTLAVALAVLPCAGCGLTAGRQLAERLHLADAEDSQVESPLAAESSAAESTVEADADRNGAPQHSAAASASSPPEAGATLPTELLASLGGPSWFLATARTTGSPPQHRWRHVGVEEALARGTDHSSALVELSRGESPAAVAAAVTLVRLGNDVGLATLTAAVRNYRLPLAARRAAAEALGEISDTAAADRLRELCGEFAAAAHEGAALYAVELHADLTDWLARNAVATDQPSLIEALRSPAPTVRGAALAAWQRLDVGPLPIEALDLRSDPAPAVRIRALEAIVARRPKEALDLLQAALADQDMAVREAAALGLGSLGDKSAAARLKPLLTDTSERLRAAALTALARLGEESAVLAAADNDSWLARAAAADALAAMTTPEATTVLQRLLTDASGYVRQHTVEALAQWPLEQAGPLLLDALDHSSYQTRRQVAQELARRWPPAQQFSVDAPPARRSEVLQSLRREWQTQYGRVQRSLLASAQHGAPTADALTLSEAAELVQALAEPTDAAALAQRLRQLSPEGWKSLEAAVAQAGAGLPEAMYQLVLPRVAAVYEHLESLRTGDANMQRVAARKLALARVESRLPAWAVSRLAHLLQSQTDEQVWRSALEALTDDGRAAAVEVAALALAQQAADVRRRGCEALARFGQPEHARLLVAALDDSHAGVAIAAAKALGRPGLLSDPAPLLALLDAADQHLRVTAARSLAAAGWPQGMAALERLCHDADAKVRLQAAQMLGEFADSQGVPELMRLADDPVADVRLAALANLPRAAGHDPTKSSSQAGAVSAHERLHAWKRWWSEQQAAATSQPRQ